ncbi:Piso0_000181 [Millerozyma farinosa CBS 7064]|uniref:Piso0_000181 protein n=1 Tax=Pichia sorbitophila (strain ATCC MYA-4447 / BCRC 22081 / CBS 7064 / NBRC 10061 / NRRL Y-12695) TaxID=559304 RepID=G8YTA7_PICSO|nr:Piso0_000181 [Millerozyma farinosa CBS 7064]
MTAVIDLSGMFVRQWAGSVCSLEAGMAISSAQERYFCRRGRARCRHMQAGRWRQSAQWAATTNQCCQTSRRFDRTMGSITSCDVRAEASTFVHCVAGPMS